MLELLKDGEHNVTPITIRVKNVEQNVANAKHLGYVGSTPGTRKPNDWYTPNKYVSSVRKVLKTIDLDPFSSPAANQIVKAARFYTEEDDAFTKNWDASTVWMNPPYSGGLVAKAVNKFLDELEKKSFPTGIILVNNATETKWFQRALGVATSVCFTDHRISFWTSDQKRVSGNTRGQTFFFFGPPQLLPQFAEEFSSHGKVINLNSSPNLESEEAPGFSRGCGRAAERPGW